MKRMRIALSRSGGRAAALALAGCAGGGGAPTAKEPSQRPAPDVRRPAPRWPTSPRRARSPSARSSTSRCSASSALDGVPEGFDVEIAQDHRERARHRPRTTSSGPRPSRPTASRSSRTARSTSSSRTYTINDKRKEVISLRRSVLHGRAVDPGARRQRRHQERGRPRRPARLLGDRARRPPRSSPRSAPSPCSPTRTPTASSRCAAARSSRCRPTTSSSRASPPRTRASSRSSASRSPRSPTASASRRTTPTSACGSTTCSRRPTRTARYEEAWNSTAGTVLPYVEPPAVDRY